MLCIEAQALSFSYENAEALFAPASWVLRAGWCGLVGENGSGKSTLLRLLLGALRPSNGALVVRPRGATVAVVTQGIEHVRTQETALTLREDRVAVRLRARFGLESEQLERWSSLSPGQRKRWQLAAALASEPSVLLLDEPHNHLDAEGTSALLGALRGFSGIGVLVSHERALHEALTTRTLRLHERTLTLYEGSYEKAREQWLREEQARWDERESLRETERAVLRTLATKRQERAGAEQQRSSRARMKSSNDHDGRNALRKGAANAAEKRLGRAVSVQRAKAERLSETLSAQTVKKPRGGSVAFAHEQAPKTRLLSLQLDELRAGTRALARDVRVVLERDTRVHLTGPNGVGKSTLLRELHRALALPEERVLWLPQEHTEDEERALQRALTALEPAERGRVLAHAAALGLDPERVLRTPSPSPGEARKLRLAMGLGGRFWVLLLDEPTNHLDVPAIERLEAALAAWPGALVLLTHDATLARRCTTQTWMLADERLRS